MSNDIYIAESLDGSGEEMKVRLTKALVREAFSNRHTLHPRRFGEIAESILSAYAEHLRTGQVRGTVELGRALSAEGVGLKSVQSLFAELRDYCWRTLDSRAADPLRRALESTEGFIFALIEGVMAGREGYILREQERLHRAAARAQEVGARESFDPGPSRAG